ncbi:MAG: glycosyltransferase [Anaerolineae bacterium]
MIDLLLVPVAICYLVVIAALFVYGVNFFYLTYRTLRDRQAKTAPPPLTEWPRVTVQLPIYNELYVAERLVQAAARLDYPQDLLEIQVLDDSTDETAEIIRGAVERCQQEGIPIRQLRRAQRDGFKAGALSSGLTQAYGEFVAIFDADFVPAPDFLKRTLPYFRDSRIAFIQTRWGHVNRDYSLLTYLQSLAIDAHFMVEQFARSRGHYWFNFNGTAGIWRKQALEDAGGWKADTLTEDLDLSYRAFLRGWSALYLRDVEVPAELPVSFSAYRRQQGRWARGSFECAIKLLPQVWQSKASWSKKMEATLHLTGYGVHFFLFAMMALYPVVVLLSARFPGLVSLFGLAFVFTATTFAPTLLFIVAQQQLGRSWWRELPAILFISLLGVGMMVNTARAALQAVSHHNSIFERTPKFGITRKEEVWQTHRYQLRIDSIVFFEIGFALWNAWTVWIALQNNSYAIAAYSALFCLGLAFTSGLTLVQGIEVYRQQNRIALPVAPNVQD